MKLQISRMGGIRPVTPDGLLPDNAAVSTTNVIAHAGQLYPVKKSLAGSVVSVPSSAKSFWVDGSAFMYLKGIAPVGTSGGGSISGVIPNNYFVMKDGIPTVIRPRTIFRDDRATFAHGPLSADAYQRIYSAGSTDVPKVHFVKDYDYLERALGAPSLANSGGKVLAGWMYLWQIPESLAASDVVSPIGIERADAEVVPDLASEVNCSYVLTAVSDLGEEGVPSDPSNIISRYDSIAVSTTLESESPYLPDYFPNFDQDNYSYQFGAMLVLSVSPEQFETEGVAEFRLYRVESDTYNYCMTIPKSAFSDSDPTTYRAFVIDRIATASLGEACPSENFDPPPSNMQGITNVAGGVMAGWFDNVVCFSMPYMPHAWPVEYQYSLPSDTKVMGLVAISGGLIAITNTKAWIFAGTDPGAMSQEVVDGSLPCRAAASIVDMGEYAVYVSSNGLQAVSVNESRSLTEGLFGPVQWLDSFSPGTFVAFRHRGAYVCFHSLGAFVFDPAQGLFPVTDEYIPDGSVLGGMTYDGADILYLLVDDDGKRVRPAFCAGPADWSWSSKRFDLPPDVTMGCIMVRSTGPVDVVVDGDEYSVSLRLQDSVPEWLPPGRPRYVRVSLSSSAVVESVTLAASMSELAP